MWTMQADSHYNGFCNSVLWQLFHYVPLNMDSKLSESQTLFQQWEMYKAANMEFAKTVLDIYRKDPEQVVWVQDYHLMLLPQMLKQRHHQMRVRDLPALPLPPPDVHSRLPIIPDPQTLPSEDCDLPGLSRVPR
jgi:trehalose-6-phosphate synthase